jgi:hypothetical protein
MTILSRRAAARLLLAVATPMVASRAQAQSFPTRPVRIIVPFPPGQANDIFCRLLADKVSEGRFRANRVVTENRAGAGGTIGMQAVARSAPDGYTLGFGSLASLAINPAIMKNMPYDAERDFVPILRIFEGPLVLVVPKDGPRDVAELVRRLKAGGMNYGSSGPGSTQRPGAAHSLSRRGPGPDRPDGGVSWLRHGKRGLRLAAGAGRADSRPGRHLRRAAAATAGDSDPSRGGGTSGLHHPRLRRHRGPGRHARPGCGNPV